MVYVNPEGVRAEEMERLFEVMQVDVKKYDEKGFDFNARIGLGAEYCPNSNGRGCWI